MIPVILVNQIPTGDGVLIYSRAIRVVVPDEMLNDDFLRLWSGVALSAPHTSNREREQDCGWLVHGLPFFNSFRISRSTERIAQPYMHYQRTCEKLECRNGFAHASSLLGLPGS
jgi:hypothetical protein